MKRDVTKMELEKLVQALPKAELHIHLEGALNPATTLKLAHKYAQLGFVTELEALQSADGFASFEDFRRYYGVCMELMRSADDFAQVVYEYGRDMQAQNIRYSEVYLSIYQHLHLQGKDLDLADVLSGIQAGRQRARTEFGVEIQWIFGIPRKRHFSGPNSSSFDPTIAETVLAYAIQGQEHGVIGIGLGGNEVGAPPHPFKDVFEQAKQMGLCSLPHAGETAGPKSVWGAINELQADRICHGVRAIEDLKLVAELIKRQIPLDICPTSNICINIYPSMSQHPIYELDKLGIQITINSDDPTLFGTSLCDEYMVLAREFGYTAKDLVRFATNSFQVSCAPPDLKKKYLSEVTDWQKQIQASQPCAG
jgi:adenosine deaminase